MGASPAYVALASHRTAVTGDRGKAYEARAFPEFCESKGLNEPADAGVGFMLFGMVS